MKNAKKGLILGLTAMMVLGGAGMAEERDEERKDRRRPQERERGADRERGRSSERGGRGGQKGSGQHGRKGGPGSFINKLIESDRMAEHLEITDEQREQLKKQAAKFEKQQKKLHEQLKEAAKGQAKMMQNASEKEMIRLSMVASLIVVVPCQC